jgi:hypothetical protein
MSDNFTRDENAAYDEMIHWAKHTMMPNMFRETHAKLLEVSKKHGVEPWGVLARMHKYPFSEVYPWLPTFLYHVLHIRSNRL